MSLIISFSRTSPALLAGRKDVTRRGWKPNHAKKFKVGQVVQAWDHQPRTRKGKQIAWIRITREPYLEPLAEMPISDYEGEGFAYLYHHTELLPYPRSQDEYSWAAFFQWRREMGSLYVVRFKLEEVVSDQASQPDNRRSAGTL